MVEEISRRELIKQTTMVLVAELGLKGTTISQISKRAKMSAGIIYHYFSSKDEIIHSLFEELESDFISNVLRGDPFDLSIQECYQRLWLNAFNYFSSHIEAMMFVESYSNSVYFESRIGHQRDEFLKQLAQKNEESISKGEMKSLPIFTIYAIVIRPAIEMAKLKNQRLDFLGDLTIEEIAETVCSSIFN